MRLFNFKFGPVCATYRHSEDNVSESSLRRDHKFVEKALMGPRENPTWPRQTTKNYNKIIKKINSNQFNGNQGNQSLPVLRPWRLGKFVDEEDDESDWRTKGAIAYNPLKSLRQCFNFCQS